MKDESVIRDERTTMVENASYRLAYQVVTLGLLAIIGFRAWVWGETNWDLFGLVFLGGVVTTVYQAWQRALTPGWLRVAALIAILAAAVAVLMVLVRAL